MSIRKRICFIEQRIRELVNNRREVTKRKMVRVPKMIVILPGSCPITGFALAVENIIYKAWY